jgi:hypothetical protein
VRKEIRKKTSLNMWGDTSYVNSFITNALLNMNGSICKDIRSLIKILIRSLSFAFDVGVVNQIDPLLTHLIVICYDMTFIFSCIIKINLILSAFVN